MIVEHGDTPKQHSALTGWVLAIIRAMQADNIDTDQVLANIGMDPALLEGGYSRYSQSEVSQLWLKAVELTGDPHFGLQVVAQVRPSTFHVIGYSMSCSASLGRALQRFSQYCRLISDSTTASLTESGDHVTLEFHFDTGGSPPIYQTVNTVLASVVGFLRWIVNEEFNPVSVRLRHGAGEQPEKLEHFFSCPIFFDQPQTCLVFEKEALSKRVMSSDEELASLLDGVADRFLEQRMADRFSVRVRDLMISLLPDEVPTKARVAQLLSMTERTLLRRLKTESTTFSGVLRQLRMELSFEYLRRGMHLSEVAYLLGFSDQGTFSRAFKGWTGRRPSMFSQELE